MADGGRAALATKAALSESFSNIIHDAFASSPSFLFEFPIILLRLPPTLPCLFAFLNKTELRGRDTTFA